MMVCGITPTTRASQSFSTRPNSRFRTSRVCPARRPPKTGCGLKVCFCWSPVQIQMVIARRESRDSHFFRWNISRQGERQSGEKMTPTDDHSCFHIWACRSIGVALPWKIRNNPHIHRQSKEISGQLLGTNGVRKGERIYCCWYKHIECILVFYWVFVFVRLLAHSLAVNEMRPAMSALGWESRENQEGVRRKVDCCYIAGWMWGFCHRILWMSEYAHQTAGRMSLCRVFDALAISWCMWKNVRKEYRLSMFGVLFIAMCGFILQRFPV